jgi:hypothetical protein
MIRTTPLLIAALLLGAVESAPAQELRAFYSAVAAPQPELQPMSGGTFQLTFSAFEHVGIRAGFSVATGSGSTEEQFCDSYSPEWEGCLLERATRRTEYGALSLGLVGFSPRVAGLRGHAAVSMVRGDLHVTRSGMLSLRSEQAATSGLPAGGTEWAIGADFALPRLPGLSLAAEYAWKRFDLGDCAAGSFTLCGAVRPNQLRVGAALRVGRFAP